MHSVYSVNTCIVGPHQPMPANSLIAPDVTAAMLMERTMAKKSLGNLTRLLFKT